MQSPEQAWGFSSAAMVIDRLAAGCGYSLYTSSLSPRSCTAKMNVYPAPRGVFLPLGPYRLKVDFETLICQRPANEFRSLAACAAANGLSPAKETTSRRVAMKERYARIDLKLILQIAV